MIWSLTGCILLNSGKIELGTTETTETTDCEETTVYQDLDGDGYGGSEEFNLCNTEGYISVGGDCNDNDALIHPEASEICDEVDNDCDQLIDDNDNNLIINQPVYPDNDGDGYGGTQEYFFCIPPNNYVGNANDCDDNDETSTNRLIDNDCDQSQNQIGCISIDVDDNQTTENDNLVNRILIYENVPFLEDTPTPVGYFLMTSDNEYCSSASILSLQYETLEPFPQSEVEFTLYRNATELLGQGVTSVQGGLDFEDEYYYDGIDLLIIGEDCDDDDVDLTDIVNDLDCDGVLGVDDCDDQEPNSSVVSEDHDCDGLSNTQDSIFDGDYWIDAIESQLKLDRIQPYQEINGDLYIQGSTITELQFSNLISVDNILIEDNSEIDEIAGFNALSEVNNLIIKGNKTLTSLQGFSGLDRIDGTLQISNNDVLSQITLSNITYIDSLWLTNNPSLTLDQVSFLSDSSNVTISSCYSAVGWCPEI